ncbi:thioredoxin-like protein [Dioszegia hungarica]|uniref:Thioredoxin-like protein n=1 Tax=Dioszegia hungarica TaxID=4972 RepID=A0AA38LPL5_9TREE|nr:thioredoxin-like protein [Dioszegia hungarica]KAI9632247.1 thioredoxin-like protein [Dioszegia hungarica]
MSFPKQLPNAVKEIRLHLCQTAKASQGLRQFVVSNYPSIKSSNPDVKLLVREASGVEAKAFVRFERGAESQTSLANLSEKDVGSALARLIASQSVGKA